MKFWVDFSGYMSIEANSQEEANTKFWDWVNSLNVTGDYSDDVWDVESIVER